MKEYCRPRLLHLVRRLDLVIEVKTGLSSLVLLGQELTIDTQKSRDSEVLERMAYSKQERKKQRQSGARQTIFQQQKYRPSTSKVRTQKSSEHIGSKKFYDDDTSTHLLPDGPKALEAYVLETEP